MRNKTTHLLISFLAVIAIGCDKTISTEMQQPTTKAPPQQESPTGNGQKDNNRLEPWKIETPGEETVNKLLGYAQMLRTRRGQVPVEQRLKDRRTLIKIADRLGQEKLKPNQKLAMFQIKSQSLLALHGSGDAKARDQVVELIETYRNDPDLNMSRTAGFLELSLVMSEFVNKDSATDGHMRNKFKKMAEKFPDDPAVAQQLNMMAAQLIAQRKRPSALRIMRDMHAIFSKSQAEAMKDFPERLHDRIHLVQSEHDLAVAEAIATRQSKKLLAAVKKLMDYDGGFEIYQETIRGVRILEQFDLYDEVKTLNERVLAKYSTHAVAKIAELSRKDTRMGNQRLALVGKPLSLTGVSKDGKVFEPSALEEKVTLVVFWSAKAPVSVRAMQPLLNFYARFNADGLEIVSLCIDENVEQAVSIFGNQHPPWISLFSSNDAYQEMIDEIGIQMVPYVILLDRNGDVDKIHVPLRDIEENLTRLLGTSEQFEEAPGNFDGLPEN